MILCDTDAFSVEAAWLRSEPEPRLGSQPVLMNQERELIEAPLAEGRGRISDPDGAARRLGVPRTTLEYKIKSPALKKQLNSRTVEDGLSPNVLNTIVQTRNGFLWIGTDVGMNRLNARHLTPILFSRPNVNATRRRQNAGRGPDRDSWIGNGAGLVRITRLALDPFDRLHREIGRPTS
jgi:Bacterial regulatory protein, Fis family/Two component regulator propeller